MATARRHSEGFPPAENPDFRTTRRWSLLRWCAEKRNFFFSSTGRVANAHTHTHTLKLFLLLLFFTSLHFALLLRWPAPKPPHSLWVKNRLTCLCAAEPNSAAQQTRTTTTSHHQAGAERTVWNEGMRSFSCSFARARTQMKFWEARQGDLKVRGRFY